MRDIKELSLEELQAVFKGWGEAPFRAKQVFSWVYLKQARDFSVMSDIPAGARAKLKEEFYIAGLKVLKRQLSRDGTEKFLFELHDKALIEGVLIPAEGRSTGCISTQVGCKFACSFCASGVSAFKRDLTSGEMLDQVLLLQDGPEPKKLTHIVFMGTGEPLDNYDNVLRAIRAMNAPYALKIGARRITVSTCGIIPGIKRLAQEGLQIELSVSLHAADDATRSRIMPVNRKYPLHELIGACREYALGTKRQVTFEYILMKDINSDLRSAGKLGILMRGFDCKINLIPANAVAEAGVFPPGKSEILLFRNALAKAGVRSTIRKSRGQDIDAACGQLRLRYEKK